MVFVFALATSFVLSFGAMRFVKNNFVPILVFLAVIWTMYGPWHMAHLL
jgi:hypothetical protein